MFVYTSNWKWWTESTQPHKHLSEFINILCLVAMYPMEFVYFYVYISERSYYFRWWPQFYQLGLVGVSRSVWGGPTYIQRSKLNKYFDATATMATIKWRNSVTDNIKYIDMLRLLLLIVPWMLYILRSEPTHTHTHSIAHMSILIEMSKYLLMTQVCQIKPNKCFRPNDIFDANKIARLKWRWCRMHGDWNCWVCKKFVNIRPMTRDNICSNHSRGKRISVTIFMFRLIENMPKICSMLCQ